MAKSKKIKDRIWVVGYLVRHFGKKHRISIRDQHGDGEVWYMYISPLRIMLAVAGLFIIISAAVIITAIYTPILDLAPGYPGKKSREVLRESIMRLDSLETELGYVRAYSENVALIMEGHTPATPVTHVPVLSMNRELIPPSAQDSLLRGQIEGSERYELSTRPVPIAPERIRTVTFLSPVEGAVVSPFSPVGGMYGVGYKLTESQQVVAADEGTVVISTWTPSEDYIIGIQHKDNFISIYKHNSQLLKQVGDRVESGEAIAYVTVTGAPPASWGDGEFVFELWSDGRPVDPSHYISF